MMVISKTAAGGGIAGWSYMITNRQIICAVKLAQLQPDAPCREAWRF
jgi:hypothetical protein